MSRKICFYSIATHLGGAEKSLLELVKGLQERPEQGYKPWVLLPKEEGPLLEQLRLNRIEYSILPMPPRFMQISRASPSASLAAALRTTPELVRYLLQLRELILAQSPVLIHTTGIKCHALAALIQPALGIPVLWHLRDILTPGLTWTLLHGLKLSAKVRVVSNSAATARAFAVVGDPGWVVHNGLKETEYFPDRNRIFHHRFKISDELPVVGILGVLARWKGQIEFLQMARQLLEDGADAHFVIIGSGIYDTEAEKDYPELLKREVSRLGLTDRVHFTGFMKDSAQAINGLDILVHASIKPEPFGRVILEAMACGVPVAAARDGGVVELIQDGITGLLFAPGDISQMRESVEKLLHSAPLRAELSRSAREKYLHQFTQRQHVDRIVEIYTTLAARQ